MNHVSHGYTLLKDDDDINYAGLNNVLKTREIKGY